MIPSLLFASTIVGLASWMSYALGRWRTLDAARCAQAVQEGMQALDLWLDSDRAAFFAKVEAFAETGEIPGMQTLDYFDGLTIKRVTYRGAKINTWEGGAG